VGLGGWVCSPGRCAGHNPDSVQGVRGGTHADPCTDLSVMMPWKDLRSVETVEMGRGCQDSTPEVRSLGRSEGDEVSDCLEEAAEAAKGCCH